MAATAVSYSWGAQHPLITFSQQLQNGASNKEFVETLRRIDQLHQGFFGRVLGEVYELAGKPDTGGDLSWSEKHLAEDSERLKQAAIKFFDRADFEVIVAEDTKQEDTLQVHFEAFTQERGRIHENPLHDLFEIIENNQLINRKEEALVALRNTDLIIPGFSNAVLKELWIEGGSIENGDFNWSVTHFADDANRVKQCLHKVASGVQDWQQFFKTYRNSCDRKQFHPKSVYLDLSSIEDRPLKRNPALPLLNIPNFGYYNHGNDYLFAFPQQLIRLRPELITRFPESVQKALLKENADFGKLDVFINISDAFFLLSQTNRMNLVVHPWVFPDLQWGEEKKSDVHLGLFEAIGMSEILSDGGIAFNHLRSMPVNPHEKEGNMACSPDNAIVEVDQENDAPILSAYSVAVDHNTGRSVVTFHVLSKDGPLLNFREIPEIQNFFEK